MTSNHAENNKHPIPPTPPNTPPQKNSTDLAFPTFATVRPVVRPLSSKDSGNDTRRSSSTDRSNKTRNSITVHSGSGTNLTLVELRDSKSATEALRDWEKDKPKSIETIVSRHNLYKEAMYTCAHMLGTPSTHRFPATQEEMCIYIHGAFSESGKEQEAVIDHVRNEPFPLTIVNTRVKRAEGLFGSKPNGFVDPYCVVTIETEDSVGKREWKKFSSESQQKRDLSHLRKKNLHPSPENRSLQIYEKIPQFIKTTLQRHTKDPRWDQRFQCLALRPSVDKLTVEVWDHSIDDKYVAKAIRNSEPDAIADLDNNLKTYHANADRKKGDVFLGKVSLKVSQIPCDGLDNWYHLSGTSQSKEAEPHGKLRLQLWLVHAYRHGRHFREVAEPKVMLEHFWDWVLKTEKATYADPQTWDGSIPSAATCFLFQYALQNGISEDTHAIIRWNAYAKHDLSLHTVEGVLTDLKDAMEKQEKVIVTADGHSQTQAPPQIRESQANIEDDIMKMIKNKIIPVIRNHLNETAESVHDALRSYQESIQIIKKFDRPFLLQKIEWLVISALRMGILEWYQDVFSRTVPDHKTAERRDYVSSVAQVMREVNTLLKDGTKKWAPQFWMIGAIEYLPNVYSELQMVVKQDVETTCWLYFEDYNDTKKLRTILLSNDEEEKAVCTSFFTLYAQTYKFVVSQEAIFPEEGRNKYCYLETFHRWFRPVLVLWLGYALIQGSTMISKTINIDDNVQDNPYALTSSSALDTATVFCQLLYFWEALRWPDIAEGYIIINFLMDVMSYYAILYAELKHAKLEKEGYYDPHGRFTISEKLCTALNNIEHVKAYAQSVPSKVNYKELEKLLEDACGKTTKVSSYEENARERLEETSRLVDKHIDHILENVGIRLQKEMTSFVEQSFNNLLEVSYDRLDDAIEPIMAYLEDNINTLHGGLLPHIFHKILQLLWNIFCRSVQAKVGTFELGDLEEQFVFFKRVLQVVPSIQTYFRGGEVLGLSNEELDTKDYHDMDNLIKYFTMSTNEVFEIYYYLRGQTHMNYNGPAPFGTIRVRVGYWNGKVGVEVISAEDLTPHDEPITVLKYFQKRNPTSDAMVEVELKPTTVFPNLRKQTTEIKWNNLNPTFEQSFYWTVPIDDCLKPSTAIVLTVKDYDLLSKNDFLGEAVIPLHVIPGISGKPEPQPMNLKLLEVDPNHPALTVLKSRKWDNTAMDFCADELSRFVEPVISRIDNSLDRWPSN